MTNRASMLLLMSATLLAGAAVLAQEHAPKPPPTQSEMKKLFNDNTAQAKLPADVHAALSAFVGEFTTQSEARVVPPPAEPMRAHAHTSGKWIMGDLFVQVNAAADPDEELKGQRQIIYGYDPAAKKYTMWQIESGQYTATSAVGDYDAATRTFTFEGERTMGALGKIGILWTIAVQEDGALKQAIKLKAAAGAAVEFVTVTHTKVK